MSFFKLLKNRLVSALIFILSTDHSNCYHIPLFLESSQKTKVSLHLERFNERYNLLHIGISFTRNNKELRYDFRPHSETIGYLTSNMDRSDIRNIFPEAQDTTKILRIYRQYLDAIIFDTRHIECRDIFWGYTNYTFDEIIEFEKTLHRRYRLGIYDCRHYVSRFTSWSLDNPTPIWTLHKIWNIDE